MLLLLWCRPAAVVLIGPLVWELPYATRAALKRKKKKENYKLHDALCEYFYLISNSKFSVLLLLGVQYTECQPLSIVQRTFLRL